LTNYFLAKALPAYLRMPLILFCVLGSVGVTKKTTLQIDWSLPYFYRLSKITALADVNPPFIA